MIPAAREGVDARPTHSPTLRFLADAMHGGLARWLRVLGWDTLYDPSIDDPQLVAIAAKEGRLLLTRDRHLVLHRRPERALLIRSNAALDQLREVVDACDLVAPTELFTRCIVCNGVLLPAGPEAIDTLPQDIRASAGPFRSCPSCGKLYWQGSHTRRMRATLAARFPEWTL